MRVSRCIRLLAAVALVACSQSHDTGPVSSGSSSSSTNSGGACSSVTPCGGNAVGTWNVTSSCLTVSGALDAMSSGFGCATAPVTGSLQVSGALTIAADGTYTDNTTTSGTLQFTLAPNCLTVSSTPVTCDGAASFGQALGFTAATCTTVASGGCDCTGTVNQMGGLAVVNVSATTGGSYTASGNGTDLIVGGTDYAYCVAAPANVLTVTPKSENPIMAGSISLQRSGSGSGSNGTAASSTTMNASASTGTSATSTRGSTSSTGSGAASSASSAASTMGPCDIYKSDPSGTVHCAAAHSTVRALFGAYSGKLYQVRNAAGTTKDIPTLAAGGVADSSVQDAFCAGTTCVITVLYDQSGNGNDVWYEGPGSPVGGGPNMQPCNATKESIMVGGHPVYSLYYDGTGHGYWADGSKNGMPLNAEPQGVYMVTSGTHTNGTCCFDYGNGETNRKYASPGAMDAVNFSSITAWGTGAGSGPWVMADLEAGLYSQGGGGKNGNDSSQTTPFVTAVEKNNGTTEFAIRGSDATSGSLGTFYKGALPPGYNPMKKQGSIVVGSGGDCCATNTNLGYGTFYEGCIVAGYPADATEDAVQANIVAAKYSK